jgi:NOL1/NOP2/sun family putative RNA methylase
MGQLPVSLLKELQTVKGFDEAAFVQAHQQVPPTSIRLNPLKQANIFTVNEQVPWCGEGRYLDTRPVFTLDPLFHAGCYYVQEASSMFLDHMLRSLLRDRSGLRVLDLCAAPGGKSTLIASLLEKDSLLVSNEVIRTRASILEENLTRWGYMNTWVTSNDARDLGKLEGYFDVIVVDAPCSGSGLFRKDEKALDEWSEGNVQLCSERQKRILADIWPALKTGGVLIYATCSYSPQEDEQILDWLSEEFEVKSLSVPIEEGWSIATINTSKQMYGYRFFPHQVKGEGFFIAAVQKHDETETIRIPKSKSVHNKKASEQSFFLLNSKDWLCIQTDKENYSAILPQHDVDWHILSNYSYIRKAGVQLGSQSAKEWLPAHDVALSIDKSTNIPAINVNKEQALRFLKKEDTNMPLPGKGWYLIAYENYGLGWIKSLGNRFNNYLPKHWRIRMDINEADWN